MTVTVEFKNNNTLNLLKELENLGLIHVQPSVSQDTEAQTCLHKQNFKSAETVHESPPPYQRLRGIHKNLTGSNSVENFLTDCRADKERELAIERRQEEERKHFAKSKLSS